MPLYLQQLGWLKTFWPLAIFALLITLVIWSAYWLVTDKEGKAKGGMLIIFGFSSLGMAVGMLTGDSGAEAISTVLPAVLSLVGGLAVFLIGKQSQDAALVSASIATLSISLLLGALIGAENRQLAETKSAIIKEEQTLREEVRKLSGGGDLSELDKLKQDLEVRLKEKSAQ